MPLQYKGSSVTAVKYNGKDVTSVYYNGTLVWTKYVAPVTEAPTESTPDWWTPAPSTPVTTPAPSTTPEPSTTLYSFYGYTITYKKVTAFSGNVTPKTGEIFESPGTVATGKVKRKVRYDGNGKWSTLAEGEYTTVYASGCMTGSQNTR
jgi:hypothetical protein